MSPAASRKGSAVAGARSALGRPATSASTAALGGRGRLGKVASMPGDRAAAAVGDQPGQGQEEGGVERSASSWSHPAAASKAGATRLKPSSASAARLSMYKIMLGAAGGGGGSGEGKASPHKATKR